jgi:hypothetical protein
MESPNLPKINIKSLLAWMDATEPPFAYSPLIHATSEDRRRKRTLNGGHTEYTREERHKTYLNILNKEKTPPPEPGPSEPVPQYEYQSVYHLHPKPPPAHLNTTSVLKDYYHSPFSSGLFPSVSKQIFEWPAPSEKPDPPDEEH